MSQPEYPIDLIQDAFDQGDFTRGLRVLTEHSLELAHYHLAEATSNGARVPEEMLRPVTPDGCRALSDEMASEQSRLGDNCPETVIIAGCLYQCVANLLSAAAVATEDEARLMLLGAFLGGIVTSQSSWPQDKIAIARTKKAERAVQKGGAAAGQIRRSVTQVRRTKVLKLALPMRQKNPLVRCADIATRIFSSDPMAEYSTILSDVRALEKSGQLPRQRAK